jgi:dephospho-CoA kinase
LAPDLKISRKQLAAVVFADKNKLSRLNEITHYYILRAVRRRIAKAKREGCAGVLVDAPLLFESGFDKECDIIISVLADREERIKRIIKRDKLTYEKALARINNQASDDFIIKRSNYVIYNNGDQQSISESAANIANIIKQGDLK